MEAAITVTGLGKRFRRRQANAPQTLKSALLRGWRNMGAEVFWGLREVSFKIATGRTVGIIGRNGAGKSTLLRLIGGVGQPDTGSVTTRGRIGALLDLGSGLHPDLTGRENAFVAGVISGMTRAEVASRFDKIVAFAELEQFIDSPLRTYSSGMKMRLAFAVAAHIDPQILLIDEVLAVGDLAFQRKCIDRIAQFKKDGATILLVSHQTSQIRDLCEEVIWMREGRMVMQGPTELVLEQYLAEMQQLNRERTAEELQPVTLVNGATLQLNVNRFGSQEIQISGVRLLSLANEPVTSLEGGAGLIVEISYNAPQPIFSPQVSVTITQADGTACFDINTSHSGMELPMLEGNGSIRLRIDRLDLVGGDYFVNVGLYKHDWDYTYDFHRQVYPLQIVALNPGKGWLAPPVQWELHTAAPPHSVQSR